MPSQPRLELSNRLADFDEMIHARDTICPAGAGRPAHRRGAAVIRSSVVLLAASFEAYVEEVYDVAVDLIFAGSSEADRKELTWNSERRRFTSAYRSEPDVGDKVAQWLLLTHSRSHGATARAFLRSARRLGRIARQSSVI